MFSTATVAPTSPEIAPRGRVALPGPQESIIPRPGESLTSALFRQYDRFHGTGLSDTDQTVVLVDEHAALTRALDEALKVNAALLAEADRLRAELQAAKRESAARLELMHDAYALIDELQSQIEDAQCAALSAEGAH
jgi:hypothetical protein